MMQIDELKRKANELRQNTLRLIVSSGSGHTGGDLSAADILTTLFYHVMHYDVNNPKWQDRDRFILSKGHSVEIYYSILADLGFFPYEELRTFMQFGTRFIGHPNNKVPGIELNSGALGHGLSVGVGMAIAGKMDHRNYTVYVLMGDGELAEGSIWEAAMSASHYNLDNLCAIVDRNTLQISGNTEEVMRLEPLNDKWKAFGFEVLDADGHDPASLIAAFQTETVGPKLIMAHTVKGKGVSFMENEPKWHHGVPTHEQLEKAIHELDGV